MKHLEKSLTNLLAFDDNLTSVSYTSDIINISTTKHMDIYTKWDKDYKKPCFRLGQVFLPNEFYKSLVLRAQNYRY